MDREVALYVGDRVLVSREFAKMVLEMLPEGYAEVLIVDGAVETPQGKLLRVTSIERHVPTPLAGPMEAP